MGLLRRGLADLGVAVIAGAAALLIFVGGAGFLAAALFTALDAWIGTPFAALVTGLAALSVGVCSVAATARLARGRRTRPPPRLKPATPSEVASIDALLDKGLEATRAHPHACMALAALVGVAVGMDPRLRDSLLRALR